MIENYEKFLEELDSMLKTYFESHKEYIKCKKGCSICCKNGDFPMSQIEFTYITKGYINLPNDIKKEVQKNINQIKQQKEKTEGRFEYDCPFLINDECSVYKYRGIICRTFGLCYYDDVKKYLRFPGCVNFGLNYSEVYDVETNTTEITDIPKQNLRTDVILNSLNALKYNIDAGEIRPLIDWIK